MSRARATKRRTAPPADHGAAMQHALAVRLLHAGRSAEALATLDALLSVFPAHAEALNDSAIALVKLGRVAEAVDRFGRALNASPDYAAAHHNLGLLFRQLGRLDEASAAFTRSLALNSSDATWWVDAANTRLAAMQPAEALAAYDTALRLEPRHLSAMSNRALALRALMRIADAEAACREVIALAPEYADAWSNLGLMLKEADRLDEAGEALARASTLAPDSVVVGANLCALHLQAGRRDEALAVAQALVDASPASAEAWNALSHAQMELASFDAAAASCHRALALAPADATAAFNLAVVELLRGDFANGLEHYEARRALTNQLVAMRRPDGPEWDGAPLHGETILLSAEQGAGDMFQFVRYAALLKTRGAGRVILEAQPSLASLLATSPGVDAVARTDESLPRHALHAPLLSLPRLLGTRLETIPGEVPYLQAPQRPVAERVRSGAGLRVGFVWSGNPRQNRNRLRSVPFAALLEALDQPGVSLFSLQVGAAPNDDFGDAVRGGRVIDLGPDLRTFADTAAAMAACDLVVSVCTSVAHLAGALGRPTWTLLAHVADWRWLQERPDSPWYPTMRLFRQHAFDDWSAPLAAARAELAMLVAGSSGAGVAGAPARPIAAISAPTQDSTTTPATIDLTAAAFQRATRLHVGGQPDEALAAYDEVLAVAPAHAEALNNSAVLLAQRGDPAEAELRVRAAIAVRPAYGQAHNNLALLLRSRGAKDEAIEAFERAVACEPQHAQWWLDYANCATERMRHETALRAFDRALALEPRNATIVADRAIALRGVLRHEDAIDACRRALALDARNPAAHANLGMFLKEARRWDEAEAAFHAGLAVMPDHPLLLTNLSTLYLEWGRIDLALATSDRLVAVHPQHPEGYNGRGCALLEQGDIEGSRREFRRAQALDPANGNAEWNLAFVSLLEGDLAAGLLGFERRRTLNGLVVQSRELPGVEWEGGPLNGRTVFVHEEQGLGDVLQFVRYAAELKARGAGRVIIETSADAASLVATAPGVDEVSLRGAPTPSYDVFVPLMSLPYRCATRLETIPARVPYLRAGDRPAATLVRNVEGRLKVGLVWGGNPRNQRDKFRSVPLPALLSAVQLEGVALFSLQKGAHAAALAPWRHLTRIIDLDPHLETLEDTAAAIGALDLVITICTSVAHLAGALDRPVWTLLANVADWRWFRDRADTPWYPSMRLFRQPSPGDWSRPLGQVHSALHDLLLHPPVAAR